MTFLANWRDVIAHAWSVRLVALAGALTGLEVAAPYLNEIFSIPTGLFAALSGLASAAALVARVLAQKEITAPTEETPNE